MKLLMALVDALVGFVQRNPLLILVILLLAIGAPALLRDIATVVLYVIGGLVAVLVILVLIFYLRIRAARRQMEKQFGQQFGGDPFGSAGRNGFGGTQHGFGGRPPHGDAPREGEVHVYQTHDAPEKRISSDVGDYVDFEETKNDD